MKPWWSKGQDRRGPWFLDSPAALCFVCENSCLGPPLSQSHACPFLSSTASPGVSSPLLTLHSYAHGMLFLRLTQPPSSFQPWLLWADVWDLLDILSFGSLLYNAVWLRGERTWVWGPQGGRWGENVSFCSRLCSQDTVRGSPANQKGPHLIPSLHIMTEAGG